MNSPVRIAFAGFKPGFKPEHHILGLILKERLGAVFVDDVSRADLLIDSIFGNAARSFEGPRLFYTEEPVWPRREECHYAMTCLREGTLSGDRHFHFPAWLSMPTSMARQLRQRKRDGVTHARTETLL